MEDTLSLISWNVTGRCNLSCKHCYLPAGRDDGITGNELRTDEALNVIDRIAIVNPEVMLILSGGEPLMRKDIFELAAYASGKGMMVVVGSNGLLIDETVASSLRRCGVAGVSISLDSVDPEIHDDARSCTGSWERAVRAVGICRDAGLSVQINAVVTKRNYGELPRLIEYSRSLGAKVFSPFFLVCTGRGEELTDITPEQYEEILYSVVETGGKCDGMMIRPRCAPTFRRILYQDDPDSSLLKMDTGRCLAGLRYCRITPEGDVTPCPYLPLSAGNVRTEDFHDIWRNSDLLASLREKSLQGKCRRCEFRLLCGGCRARAHALRKDHLAEDPWCAYIPGGGDVIKHPSFAPSFPDAESQQSGPGGTTVWTEPAEERLKKVPFFVRSMVRAAVERYAVEKGCREVTPEMMEELRQRAGVMGGMSGH
jgi:radical SAM protein with 4Fe4S-binding SPASM domain